MFLWHNLKRLHSWQIATISKIQEDIFMMWNGTKKQLKSFIHKLYKKHETIKSDYKISTNQVEILAQWYIKINNTKFS